MDQILEIASVTNLDVIQCHGQETAAEVRELKQRGYEVWKALPHNKDTLQQMHVYEEADGYVIDSKVKEQFGGTGVAFDWSFVPQYESAARKLGKNALLLEESMLLTLRTCYPTSLGRLIFLAVLKQMERRTIQKL